MGASPIFSLLNSNRLSYGNNLVKPTKTTNNYFEDVDTKPMKM